jgi:hypothetical protein
LRAAIAAKARYLEIAEVSSLDCTLWSFILHPSKKPVLSKLANRTGRKAEELAQQAIGYYLDHEVRFIAAVKPGLDSLDGIREPPRSWDADRPVMATLMDIRWSPEAAEDFEREVPYHAAQDWP